MAATVEVELDATVTSNTPMFDPVTGQTTYTLTFESAPAQFAVEAGYTSAGAFVYNQYALSRAGNPETSLMGVAQTASIRDGRLQFLDAQGAPVSGAVGGGPPLQDVLAASGQEPLQVMGGLVIDELPETGTALSFDGSAATVTDVNENGDLVEVLAEVPGEQPGDPSLTQVRTYRKEDDAYVLQEIRTEGVEQAPEGQTSGEIVVRFLNVSWSRNAARDAARANGTAGNTWGAAPSSLEPWQPICDPDAPEPCEPPDPGGPHPGGGGSGAACPLEPTGANVVFQHGIISWGSTWGGTQPGSGVRGRTRCELAVASDLTPSQPFAGLGSHASQATYLQAQVLASGRDQNILIGHSQGGLVARRVAQGFYLTGQPGKVGGVVTIGTPHQGAHIARNLTAAGLAGAQDLFNRSVACRITPSCSDIRAALTALAGGVLGVAATADALEDLHPNSPAIQQVNGTPETFPRYGIQHYPSKRWSFMRVGGDLFFTNGGPALVTATDIIVGASVVVGIGAIIFGHWGFAATLANAIRVLWATDTWYNRITAGNDARSEGIVQGASQVYPSGLRNFQALTPTSHTGETSTQRSYDALRVVLTENLGLTVRP